MPLLPSLPENAVVPHLYALDPEVTRPLVEMQERLLRGPSPLSVAQREMIAAYVSGLNACPYCHGVHTGVAEALGIEGGLVARMLEDLETAGVDPRLKPILRYVAKLTRTPYRMVQADADAVFAEGWSEQALFHAIMVTGAFNMMNRLIFGCGVELREDTLGISVDRLSRQGYLSGKST